MKKTNTYTKTITKEEYFCDICGKKLNKVERNASYPWSIVYYNLIDYKNKLDETHDEFSMPFDMCTDCNLKASKLIRNEWIEFAKKFEDKEKVKNLITKEEAK